MKQKILFAFLLLAVVACRKTKDMEKQKPPEPIPPKPIDTLHFVGLGSVNYIDSDTAGNFIDYIGFSKYTSPFNIWNVANYGIDSIVDIGGYLTTAGYGGGGAPIDRSKSKWYIIRYVGEADLVDTSRLIGTYEGYYFDINPKLRDKPVFEIYHSDTLVTTWIVGSNYRATTGVGKGNDPDIVRAKQIGAAFNYYLKKMNGLRLEFRKPGRN